MAKYERAGKPVLPQWWTDLVWPLLDKENYRKLAARASEIAGRESPWGGDAITKFRQGAAVTRELANALSRALGVAIPFWDALTEKEALEFEKVRHRSAQVIDGKSTPETQARRAQTLDALEQFVGTQTGQRADIQSSNEGSPRGLGHRRAPGRRKASTRS